MIIRPRRGWFTQVAALGGGGAPPASTTWNPSDKTADTALSGGNLIATSTSDSNYNGVRSVGSASSGKFYWEITVTAAIVAAINSVGVSNSLGQLDVYVGANSNAFGWGGNGEVNCGSLQDTIDTYAVGDVLGIAFDFTAELAWFRVDAGNWNADGSANPATGTNGISTSALNAGPYFAQCALRANTDAFTANFGATAFANAAPSGFGVLA